MFFFFYISLFVLILVLHFEHEKHGRPTNVADVAIGSCCRSAAMMAMGDDDK